jgi:hypothetical protein
MTQVRVMVRAKEKLYTQSVHRSHFLLNCAKQLVTMQSSGAAMAQVVNLMG